MSDVIAQLPDDVKERAFEGVSKSLLCEICFDPSDSWLVACPNHHSFCSTCLLSHVQACENRHDEPRCPTCRADCEFNSGGNLEPERTKNAMTLEIEVECGLNCGEKFRLDKVKNHMQNVCKNAIVPCPMAPFGCEHNMKRCEVAEHMRSDPHTHLAMAFFMKTTDAFKTEIAGLKTSIAEQNTKIESQAATISNLNTALAAHTTTVTTNTSAIDGFKTKLDTQERKLNEVLSDGPNSLKQIAEQTKKRSRPGQGQSDRSVREKSQIQRLKGELEELKGDQLEGEAEASASTSSAPVPAAEGAADAAAE